MSDVREEANTFTEGASRRGRELALAGIAICWLFSVRAPEDGTPAVLDIPSSLLIPLVFFVLALGFDWFQYLLGSALWTAWVHKRVRNSMTDSVKPPNYACWISMFFFFKFVATFAGWTALFVFFVGLF
jgi:hypothetical protein